MSKNRLINQVRKSRLKSRVLPNCRSYYLVLCFFILSFPLTVFCITTSPIFPHIPALEFSSQQKEILLKDYPFERLDIDEDWAWILGQKNIWQFDLSKKKLIKIKLPTKISPSNFASTKKYIFFGHGTNFFRIKKKSIRIFKHTVPLGGGDSLALQVHGNSVYWIRSTGVFEFDDNYNLVALIHKHKLKDPTLKLTYEPSKKRMWTSNGYNLSFYSYKDSSELKILRSQKIFINKLLTHKNEVIAITKHILMRFSSTGGLIQSIPTESNQAILSTYIKNDRHSFLVNTGVIQINSFKSRTTKRIFLSADIDKNSKELATNTKVVGLIQKGFPKFFIMNNNK